MSALNRILVLNMFIKHETLTLADAAKEENLGVIPDKQHFGFLLAELEENGYVHQLAGAIPSTYTITEKGIAEGKRLNGL